MRITLGSSTCLPLRYQTPLAMQHQFPPAALLQVAGRKKAGRGERCASALLCNAHAGRARSEGGGNERATARSRLPEVQGSRASSGAVILPGASGRRHLPEAKEM